MTMKRTVEVQNHSMKLFRVPSLSEKIQHICVEVKVLLWIKRSNIQQEKYPFIFLSHYIIYSIRMWMMMKPCKVCKCIPNISYA